MHPWRRNARNLDATETSCPAVLCDEVVDERVLALGDRDTIATVADDAVAMQGQRGAKSAVDSDAVGSTGGTIDGESSDRCVRPIRHSDDGRDESTRDDRSAVTKDGHGLPVDRNLSR